MKNKSIWLIVDCIFMIMAAVMFGYGVLNHSGRFVFRSFVFIAFALFQFLRHRSQNTNKFADMGMVCSVLILMISDFFFY